MGLSGPATGRHAAVAGIEPHGNFPWKCLRGFAHQGRVFDSPADQALAFEQAGCSWIHLVDLNGAFAGTPVNDASVRDILSKVSVP
ncbi:HisA/HisF-related TIM barrel protein, partial [Planktomarina temperata]|nr:HisA/HisF-related TIM barrel protein [Planktomarina temperata]